MSRKIAFGMLAGMAVSLTAGVAMGDDVKNAAYRSELLANASQQQSLLASAAQVGESGGHFGFSDGGNNSLYAGVFASYRTMFNFRRKSEVGRDNNFTWGNQLARVRMFFFGTVGAPNMEYFIQIGADPIGGGFDDGFFDEGDFAAASFGGSGGFGGVSLLDAMVRYKFDNGLYVAAGQGRPLMGYEENTPSQYQQFFDRSLPNDLFTPGRQQFLAVGWESEQIAVQGYISDGLRGAGLDYPSPMEADIALGGRINWAAMGDLNHFAPHGGIQHGFGTNASQSSFVDTDALLVGGGLHYQNGGDTGVGPTIDVDVVLANIDVVFKSASGFNISGHGYYAYVDPAGGDDATHWGLAVRGGIFVSDNIELYAGYEGLYLDDDVVGSEDTFHWVRVGANFFPFQDSTAVKISAEAIISFGDDDSVLFSGFSPLGGYGSGFTRSNLLGGGDKREVGIGVQLNILQ
jgi:hypothetical protein